MWGIYTNIKDTQKKTKKRYANCCKAQVIQPAVELTEYGATCDNTLAAFFLGDWFCLLENQMKYFCFSYRSG